MRSANSFEDRCPAGSAIIFDLLARIQHSAFSPTSFLSNSEWNRLGKCPTSYLKFSSEEVIDVEDKDYIPYSQLYLVSTSTKSRV